MTTREKANLASAGYTFGDFGDFLELTPAEREYVELETALARAVRASRERAGVTQTELAKRIGSSQSRIAKIETGAEGVSFDLAFKALFAVEGSMADVIKELKRGKARRAATSTTETIRPK